MADRLLETQAEMISPYNLNYDPENGLTTTRRMTNADRIRAMSDEELADKLWSIAHYEQKKRCISDWLDWLKQEVDESE